MRSLILLTSILCVNAFWHKDLKGQSWLKAIDHSKMLQVKVKGHGYFQYIMDATNRLENLCSGHEDETLNLRKL